MADRLISADALKNYLAEYYDDASSFDPYMDGWTYESFIRERIFKRIDEQPTVEAELIVRCRDCKYRDWHYCHNKNGFTEGSFIHGDDFCSRGEREEIER